MQEVKFFSPVYLVEMWGRGLAFLVCLENERFSAHENHRGRAGWGLLPIRGSGFRPNYLLFVLL